MSEQIFSNDQFALGKKWFWVGLAAALFSAVVGLIFGIALIREKGRRREGAIIIVFALVCYIARSFWLVPWLVESDLFPSYRLMR